MGGATRLPPELGACGLKAAWKIAPPILAVYTTDRGLNHRKCIVQLSSSAVSFESYILGFLYTNYEYMYTMYI